MKKKAKTETQKMINSFPYLRNLLRNLLKIRLKENLFDLLRALRFLFAIIILQSLKLLLRYQRLLQHISKMM